MNIATATVSEVPSVQGGLYERRRLEIFEICNLISRNSLLGGFMASLYMNIVTATVSDVPGVHGGPNERHPLEFFWDL